MPGAPVLVVAVNVVVGTPGPTRRSSICTPPAIPVHAKSPTTSIWFGCNAPTGTSPMILVNVNMLDPSAKPATRPTLGATESTGHPYFRGQSREGLSPVTPLTEPRAAA